MIEKKVLLSSTPTVPMVLHHPSKVRIILHLGSPENSDLGLLQFRSLVPLTQIKEFTLNELLIF